MKTLEQAALKALEAMELYPVTVNHWKVVLLPAAKALREALEQPEQQQEPVAWMHTNAVGHTYFRKHAQGTTFNPMPLYTSPPQRKPLTDEEIDAIIKQHLHITDPNLAGAVYMTMRDLEEAHGVKEQK